MATIPIEVIIQDAESPVIPTPESGEETNITVPDTGTISDVGSNSGGIGSSASSIILPATILVLALGAIVALLVRRQQKRKKSNTGTEGSNAKLSKKEKLFTAASGTIAILAATVLVGNLVIPATKAASDETNSNSDEGTYLETEDKVSIVATIDKDSKEPTIVTVKDTLYATTDASGYTVTMSMTNDALTSNLYLNGDESSEYYIAPVEAEDEDENENATKGVELATNTWGYRLSEDDGYSPVPVADTPATVAEGEAAATHEEINVYYGLKVDGTLPLGTYSGEIEYNITPVNPIDKLTYMQDFAKLSAEEKTALIAAMPEGEQYTLKDSRDGNSYYISKLADGKVWMTQNLDHDIGDIDGGTYTSADTDIPADWTPTGDELTKQRGWDGAPYAVPRSYDPGILYWNGALIYNQDTCIEYGGTWDDEHKYCSGARNAEASTGNIHYHLGNYYNWTAAVAMSDSSSYTVDNTDANQSICPAGWTLPKGGATLTGADSFIYLKDVVPLSSGANGNINTNPNYFTYSGSVSGTIYGIGIRGTYWSSVVNNNMYSYILGFEANEYINAGQSGADRTGGYSIRCITR